ncbi:MAG: hypothetical protein U0936_25105 [Planctomycetaceae bacterium]
MAELQSAHHAFEAAKVDFKTQAELFISVSEVLEALGDAQVDEIESDPEKPITWNGGLQLKWAAADGGMESSIGFLTQLFFLEQLTAGQDPERCRKEIDDSRAFHTDAMNEMLATGTFDRNFSADQLEGKFDGQRMSDVCRAEFAKVTTLMEQYISSYLTLQETKKKYDAAAAIAVAEIEKVEGLADSYVDEITASVGWAKLISALAILIPLIATVIVGFYVGMKGSKAVAAPIEAAIEVLRSTTNTSATAITRTHVFHQRHRQQHGASRCDCLAEPLMWLIEAQQYNKSRPRCRPDQWRRCSDRKHRWQNQPAGSECDDRSGSS